MKALTFKSRAVQIAGCMVAVILLALACNTPITFDNNGTTTGDNSQTPRPIGTPRPTAAPTPTPAPEAEDPDCASDEDCEGDETCDLSTGECVESGSSCVTNKDCDTGQECNLNTGTCEDVVSEGCRTDLDCEGGETCNRDTGECVSDLFSNCTASAGPCNIDNSSPGCNNMQCCEDICVLYPQCCLIQWDETCAALTFQITDCLAD